MEKITVAIVVAVPKEVAWEYFTNPQHIVKWNHASADWHTPRAENDLRVGGTFLSRMEAIDGSEGFDFTGVYTEVERRERYSYRMSDGRTVTVTFSEENTHTRLTEVFDPETEHSPEMQRVGWQSILNNFKQYALQTYQNSDAGFIITATALGDKDNLTDSSDGSSDGGTGGDGGGGD